VGLHHPVALGDEPGRQVNVQALDDWLRQEHAYAGSYKSVLRFVRAHYPRPRLRPHRRVSGLQSQADAQLTCQDGEGPDGRDKLAGGGAALASPAVVARVLRPGGEPGRLARLYGKGMGERLCQKWDGSVSGNGNRRRGGNL
jgi:hypothetical protein